MKRNIKTIAVLLVALVASIFYVHAESNPYKNLDSKEVILHYTGATLLGNSTYSKYLLAEDFEYRNTANNDTHNKKEFIKHLNTVKDLKYNSTQTVEIIDQEGNTALGKITMDFGTFKRVDYITMIQSTDGWKISKVVTTYP